jgi:HK97 family phage portal protein
MSLVSRIASAFRRPPAPALERRAGEPSWDHLSAFSAHGGTVNARTAEGLSAVSACVSAISTAIASLPIRVYRRQDAGRVEIDAHPIAQLVAGGPNRHQSWPDFAEWLTASTLLRGNGLAQIVRDGRGQVVELTPLPYDHVFITMLPSGRLQYSVTAMTDLFGGTGRVRRLLEDEVLHLRDRSDDGIVGKSRLARAASAVRLTQAVQRFASATFRNSIRPSIAVTLKNPISPDAYNELMNHLMKVHSGAGAAGMPIVVDNDGRVTRLDMSLEDAELLANRRFSVEEIARIYGVPGPLINDLTHGTFTNSETLIRFFAQSTLSAWARKIEAVFARTLLSADERRTHQIEIDLSGLLRGDPETRWASHKIAVDAQILTPNEVRETEGWSPRPGGDTFAPPREGA